MPLQATSGAASYDAFGGGVAVEPVYIEQIFSTYLYTGNGPSSQTITNGIDLAGKGGLVWTKNRTGTYGLNNSLIDTVRGNQYQLYSDLTNAQANLGGTVTNQAIASFNSNGFTLGGDQSSGCANYNSGYTYASWTFRKQPKFFDVVTYTGDGTSNRAIAHSLGAAPGMVAVKVTSTTGNWNCWHRGLTANKGIRLNTTDPEGSFAVDYFGNGSTVTVPTSTDFYVGSLNNTNGATYVAYLFAHDSGGFGLTGTDNVISCGSFTTSGGGGDATVDLGYEPQWLLVKSASGTSGWDLMDNMRGMPNYGTYGSATALEANNSNAEGSRNPNCYPTATGFYYARAASTTYIYIAIRRGSMRTPTTGTSVFAPVTQTAAGIVTTGFPVDLAISGSRTITGSKLSLDRLRGSSTNSYASLFTNSTGAEGTGTGSGFGFDNNTGYVDAFWSSSSMAYWNFRRAPGFFDEVCYTGTGSATTFSHNLGTVPEIMIVKRRDASSGSWQIYTATTGNSAFLQLSSTSAVITGSSNRWNSTTPTASVFSIGNDTSVNASGGTYLNYMFATCPGVSKVGSYTGTGAAQTIDCGFTGGARFVLIKRTDGFGGDWFVWDSARGIVAGNDPYLLLNSTAAEVTSTDYVDTYSAGFEISSTAPAAINASGGTFIFLAIA